VKRITLATRVSGLPRLLKSTNPRRKRVSKKDLAAESLGVTDVSPKSTAALLTAKRFVPAMI